MTELDRLQEKLAKLAAKGRRSGPSRALPGDTTDARLSAVLTEIEETILPRDLAFQSGDATLILAVANRRLQSLIAASAGDTNDLLGAPLEDGDETHATRIRSVLDTLVAGGPSLKVTSARQSTAFPSDIGMRSSALREIWNVSVGEAPVATADLQSFLTGTQGTSEAWIRIEGEDVVAQHGAEDVLSRLSEQAGIFLDGFFSQRDRLLNGVDGPVAVAIAPASDVALAMAYLETGDEMGFVAAPTVKMGHLLAKWQETLGV